MSNIIIYTTQFCPYCVRAKQLLEHKNLAFEEISVDNDPEKRATMQALSGGYTVPQLFINHQPIGGCDELYALEAQGKLNELINP